MLIFFEITGVAAEVNRELIMDPTILLTTK